MKIANHFLCQDDGTPVPYAPSPNIGGKLQPEYLVIHYTANRTPSGAIGTLTNPLSNVSAHLVIAPDGTITQLVPFDTVAWHAGISQWEGRTGLNQYSIGIEIVNAGKLVHKKGVWISQLGGEFADEEVIEAIHKDETRPSGWQVYTEAQIEAVLQAGQALFQEYKLFDVVGHDDIAPYRKKDPGPAFPMHSLRARLLGRAADTPPLYETTAAAPIRSGPGSAFKPLIKNPLPEGTPLDKLTVEGTWALVDVLKEINGVPDLQGWVHTRFVRRVSV